MKSLITDEQRTQLPANGRRSRSEPIGLDGGVMAIHANWHPIRTGQTERRLEEDLPRQYGLVRPTGTSVKLSGYRSPRTSCRTSDLTALPTKA
jgi:hypothetical protein